MDLTSLYPQSYNYRVECGSSAATRRPEGWGRSRRHSEASCCRQLPRAALFRNCSFEFCASNVRYPSFSSLPATWLAWNVTRFRFAYGSRWWRVKRETREIDVGYAQRVKKRHLLPNVTRLFSVERVILKIVSPSISRITPHVAMLPRLQLPRLKTRR